MFHLNIFVSKLPGPFTAAHEIGHLLTDRGHEEDSSNLMKEFTDIANTLTATKRFDILQESLIRQSAHLTNP